MKLLFICDKIDSTLKSRVDQLADKDIEVHVLELPSLALYKNWEKEVLEPKTPIDFLNIGRRFQKFSKTLQYKKLFDSLDDYEGVNIYKSTTISAPHIDSIKKIAKSYFITINDEQIEKNRQIVKTFDNSCCILFNNSSDLTKFEKDFGYDEKTLIARDGATLMSVIDNLKNEKVEKFRNYLNLDSHKSVTYCYLGKSLDMQFAFIDDLLKLPASLLRENTFIFDPSDSSLVDKERLIEYLNDKKFDFLLPDSQLTDEQKAVLLAISKNSIILPNPKNSNTLYSSLYIKNHLYFYGNIPDEEFYKEHNIFIDSYENFENSLTFNQDSKQLMAELLNTNKEAIKKLFHPEVNTQNYLEILKIL